MRMKTFGLTAAFLLAASTIASAQCMYGHDAKMAMSSKPVEQEMMSKKVVEPAAMPTDSWLIAYLETWQTA